MSELFCETEQVFGPNYFQCYEHYQMSANASSGHIACQWIPPIHATPESYCGQCVMKALGRIGADRLEIEPL